MKLSEVTNQDDAALAIEEGDEELLADIDEKLEEAKSWWANHWTSHVYDPEHGDDEFDHVARSDAFIADVKAESPPRADLSRVPDDQVLSAIEYAIRHPQKGVKRRGWNEYGTHWGPFYWDTSPGFFGFKVEQQSSVWFPGRHIPEGARFLPKEIAEEFWSSLAGDVAWEDTSVIDEKYGSIEADPVWITADDTPFTEWCMDILNSYTQDLITSDPQGAKSQFLRFLAKEDAELSEKVAAAGLKDEELLDFASKWFEDQSYRDEALDTLRDYISAMESGASDEREVVGEWSKEQLYQIGLRGGALYEEAPWKLIKLHPSDLRMEGALMRHCVGDGDMGYIRALKNGEIEIWSLRSRANKPRFTLEIDAEKFYIEDDGRRYKTLTPEFYRGRAVSQLRGKANRLAGFADSLGNSFKFPDEIVFWDHVFRQLGVDPTKVKDFEESVAKIDEARAGLQRNSGPAEACVGFDRPYRRRP